MLHRFHKQQSWIAETLQLSTLLSCLNCLRLSPSFMHKLKTATPLNQMFYTKLLWWLFALFEPTDHFVPHSQLVAVLINQWDRKNKSFLWYFMFLLFQWLKKRNKVDQVKPVKKLYSYRRKKINIKRKFWKDKVKLCDNCICYIVICTEKQLTASRTLMSSCTIL